MNNGESMKINRVSATALLLVSSIAFAQSPAVGKWRGEKRGVPWVTLNVTENNGQMGGTGVFYILDRNESANPPKVLGKQEVELVNAKLSGNTFSFQIRNQQGEATLNPSGGETLEFQMTIKGNEANLRPMDNPEAMEVKMIKQK